ncbi:mCG147307 [Mus musculus]|jgi:hypothetical protein|nr:mCG147307 [Mus musculus]
MKLKRSGEPEAAVSDERWHKYSRLKGVSKTECGKRLSRKSPGVMARPRRISNIYLNGASL